MTQRLWFGVLGGTGIVAVLFVIGIVMYLLDINASLAYVAIGFAIFIAIIFGLLGIVRILKRLIKY